MKKVGSEGRGRIMCVRVMFNEQLFLCFKRENSEKEREREKG